MSHPLLIKNGRVLDPASGTDTLRDIAALDGVLVSPNALRGLSGVEEFDATGLVVCPGLIDLHVHLREPGRPDKETIETGSRAAAAGGFTTILAMPNTIPVTDSASTVAWIRQRAQEKACVHVLVCGCLSQGQKGEVLAPFASLKKAGVVALSDDGRCIQSAELMRRAFEHAHMVGLPILDHCQDESLTADGVMNEGYWSTVLGLHGWPAIAEEIMISRNAMLADLTRHRVHCQHVTTAGGARILREARSRGVPISGEICPHHIALTDAGLEGYDTNFKMNPPLRTQADADALVEAFREGVIDILASDHAPHCDFEKEVEFQEAPFGILGLETEAGLFLEHLHHRHGIPLMDIVRALTMNPAKLLQIPKGTLAEGAEADITVLDTETPWTVDKHQSASKSRNTPFHGQTLRGRAVATFVSGRKVWDLAGFYGE